MILCLLFSSSIGLIPYRAIAQSNTRLLAYTDTNNGFTLQYPSNWTKNSTNSQNSPFVLNSPDNGGTMFVTVVHPSPENLAIAESMTLDELVRSLALPASALPLPPNELAALGINILELNSEDYFLSGHPAGRMVMTGASSDGISKMMGLATIVNDRLYAVSYMADSSTYDKYLADAQTIIDSFKIISSQ